ncbi:MAG: DHH family phosphoesterase [Phycisphaerae bacterium]|nr:DHH family phosphoesterase [Phycisphaerae bacterium]
MSKNPIKRSDRLLQAISDYSQILVVTHDNPDPDAIATGWAVRWLIRKKLAKPVRLIAGGEIVRAENRYMIKRLEPPLELVQGLEPSDDDAVILVDCGYGTSNHILSERTARPIAVIDHHLSTGRRAKLPFQDLRPRAAASASIATSYLKEQDLAPPGKLATALLYAIRTETKAYETHHSRLDHSAIQWLTPSADPAVIAEIENAPLSRAYFADLVLALERTFIYQDTVVCLLPRAEGPELVGEVADLLIRCESVKRVLCGAVVGQDLLVSVRAQWASENAAELVRSALAGIGHGGGHGHRAGGKIAGVAREGRVPEQIQDRLRTQWLDACHVDRQRGVRLIAKREIIDHL